MNGTVVVPNPIHWRTRWSNEEEMIVVTDWDDRQLTVESSDILFRLRIHTDRGTGNDRT